MEYPICMSQKGLKLVNFLFCIAQKQDLLFFVQQTFLDEEEFRNLVVWLEDQRIRLYKIEDRVELRDVKSTEWVKTLRKVNFRFLFLLIGRGIVMSCTTVVVTVLDFSVRRLEVWLPWLFQLSIACKHRRSRLTVNLCHA